jgi:hypothetical protein
MLLLPPRMDVADSPHALTTDVRHREPEVRVSRSGLPFRPFPPARSFHSQRCGSARVTCERWKARLGDLR